MQVQAEVGASRTYISNKVNLIKCYQSLQKEEICTFHYISHHFIFQKQFLVIPFKKMLDIFVDFQIILRKKNLPQLDNVRCPTAISITEHKFTCFLESWITPHFTVPLGNWNQEIVKDNLKGSMLQLVECWLMWLHHQT